MADVLSDHRIRLLRQRAQWLDVSQPGSADVVAQTVKHLVGVQAQDPQAAALAVRARCAGLVAADVELARVRDRSIVRTWCMRGTLHLVPTEDLGWLLGLLGPIFVRASRGRRARLGLDEASGPQAVRVLCDALARHGPLTRDQAVERLAERDIKLAGQARPHLLNLAALQSLICLGPMQGRQPTYVLTADWITAGPALPREQACARLAERYLAAFAPATPEDFATWSGLTLADARSAWRQLASKLIEVHAAGRALWMLQAQAGWLAEAAAIRPVLRLLPSFDNYLLGYRGRDIILATEHAKRVNSGGGLLHPVVVVDGRGVATWKFERRRSGLDLIVDPFESAWPDSQVELGPETDDIAHYFGTQVRAKVLRA